jgi:hypothetical protein
MWNSAGSLHFFCSIMESSYFLIWNVRGLIDRVKRDSVKSLVVDIRPSIVCLQETKLCFISDFDILSILGSWFSNFVYSDGSTSRVFGLNSLDFWKWWLQLGTSQFNTLGGIKKWAMLGYSWVLLERCCIGWRCHRATEFYPERKFC